MYRIFIPFLALALLVSLIVGTASQSTAASVPLSVQGTPVFLPLLRVVPQQPISTTTPTPTATNPVAETTSTPTATATSTATPTATEQSPGGPCPCNANTLNCSDFATQPEVQTCFAFCVAQGAGDIHQLDGDNNGVACESLPGFFTIVR